MFSKLTMHADWVARSTRLESSRAGLHGTNGPCWPAGPGPTKQIPTKQGFQMTTRLFGWLAGWMAG